MKYRASNGIMARVLTEAEAREHYDQAQFVSGEFGGTFITCPVGEFGGLISVAATTYTPMRDQAEQESGPRIWLAPMDEEGIEGGF